MQIPSSTFCRRAVSALAPFLFVFSSLAQTPVKGSGDATAGEVSLDVVAHDKKGATIRDLKPTDFEIFSGGSPVRMDDFHLVTGGPGPGHSQLVTLVFAHDNPGFAKTARNVAAELLKAAPRTGMLFAVLRVDGRLRLIQEFTADREVLNKAIDDATVSYKRGNDAAEQRVAADVKADADKPDRPLALQKVLMGMLLDSGTRVRDPHTPAAIADLMAACHHEGALPGRKTLVYFSSGLDWDMSDPEMPAKVADAAIRARVSFYSIDAEIVDPHNANSLSAGLNAASALSQGGIGGGGASGAGSGAAGLGTQVAQQVGRMETGDSAKNEPLLAVICHATGGEYASDSGNTTKAVQRIVDDTLSSYSAYFGPPTTSSGKFRPIRIKVLRPGVSVQARGGYLPVQGVAPLAVSPTEDKLLGALAASELPSELPFRSSVLRFEHTPNGSLSSVAVEVPLSQNAANVSVLAQVRDQTGAIVERFTDDIAKPGAADTQRGAVSFRRHFIAAPGTYVLEAAAMDAASGKIGAQRSKFEILSATDSPALGDIVLVRRIEPAGAAATDASEPLRCSEGKVVPNLSAHLSKDANPAILLFFDVQPDRRSSDKPALKLEVWRDGNLLGSVPLNLREDSTPGQPIRELAKVGTKALRPGSYDMTVVLSQGEQTTQRTLSVTLE